MSDKNDKDLAKTKELFGLLQGSTPEGCTIEPTHQPKLTPDQAWTVIWWLGNQYWRPTDAVEKCDVCGDLYHSWQEGECMDFGNAPYHFCDACRDSDEARTKARIGRGLDRAKERQCAKANAEVSNAVNGSNTHTGDAASVDYDTHQMLENWCRGYAKSEP